MTVSHYCDFADPASTQRIIQILITLILDQIYDPIKLSLRPIDNCNEEKGQGTESNAKKIITRIRAKIQPRQARHKSDLAPTQESLACYRHMKVV